MSLAVVLLALIGTQLTTTLRSIERGRVQTEREQLALAILHRIADDLKATVRDEPFDPSGMPAFTKTSSSSSSSDSGSSGTSGSSSGSGSGSSTSGGSGSSGGSSGASGGGSSGSGSSGSGSSSGSSDSSSDGGTAGPTETYYPGIYGDQYNLQIDVGRIPRLDQYYSADGTVTEVDGTAPTATDVQTVTYFLANSAEPATFNASSPTSSNLTSSTSLSSSSTSSSSSGSSSDSSSTSGSSSGTSSSTASYTIVRSSAAASMTGLVRSEIDRAISQYSSQQGDTTALDSNTLAIAPEVADIEFGYYDGVQWDTSWDTTANSGLPQAISISIVMNDAQSGAAAAGWLHSFRGRRPIARSRKGLPLGRAPAGLRSVPSVWWEWHEFEFQLKLQLEFRLWQFKYRRHDGRWLMKRMPKP